MEFLLLSIVLCISISLVFLFGRKGSAGNSKLPPGTTGWPIFGENLSLALSGPRKCISDRMKKYSGNVFRTSLLGEKMVAFCGAEGNKFMFSSSNANVLEAWMPQSVVNIHLMQDSNRKYLKEYSPFVHGFLKADALKHHIPVMDSMARQHLETDWSSFSQVKAYPLVQKYTFALGCKLLIGIDDPERIKLLEDTFKIVRSGYFSFPLNFPGMPYYRALKGSKMFHKEMIKIVKERKKQVMENKEMVGQDFLSRLLIECDENSRFISENEIYTIISGLLVASYDPTSSAVTFTLKYLAKFPNIYNKVYEEQVEIANSKGLNELLNWEDIQKMKYSWSVAREVMRLIPPSAMGFRDVTTDLIFEGFTIPKGWKAFWSPHSTHTDPKYFVNPEKFDPSRFEGSLPAPYTFVPFGGGASICAGKEYARLELLVFIHNVVVKFTFQELISDEKVLHFISSFPKDGLPLQISPHTN